MPRGRMINKKISYDEKVAKLSIEAMLLFTWLIPHLDIEGRIYGEPEILKGLIVPYVKQLTIEKIGKCLQEMVNANLIIWYGNAHRYIQYLKFKDNQTLHPERESKSDIPTPELLRSNSGVTQAQVKLNQSKVKLNQSKENVPPPTIDQPLDNHSSTLANLLHMLMLENNPQAKITEAQVKDWTLEADKLLRLDKRDLEEAKRVLEWSQADDFWRGNILSMRSFRRQYDRLLLQSKRKRPGQVTHEGLKEWLKEKEADNDKK